MMQPYFTQFRMDFRQIINKEANFLSAVFSDLFPSFESDMSFQYALQSPPFIGNQGIQMISLHRNEERSSLQSQIQEMSCTQDQENMKLKQHFDKNESHIKITVTKNQNLLNSTCQTEHYINQFGMIGSIKYADSEDVIIGRQERLENNQGQLIFPSDIKINFKDSLQNHLQRLFQEINYYHAFIQTNIRRIEITQKYHFQNFIIFGPKDCDAQDVGSIFGTHIKINRNYQAIQKYQQYSIGSETTIHILEIHNLESEQKPRDQEFDKLISKLRNPKYQSSLQGLDLKLYERTSQVDQSLDQILTNLKSYQIPFIVIKFGGSGVTDHNQTIFFAKDFSTMVSIGRGNENNIRINSNTISRKQARFRYNFKQKNWEIADGSQDKESAN